MLVTRWLRNDVGGLDAQLEHQPREGGPRSTARSTQRRLLPRSRRARVAVPDERHVPAAHRGARTALRGRGGRREAWSSSRATAAWRDPRQHLQRDAARRRAGARRFMRDFAAADAAERAPLSTDARCRTRCPRGRPCVRQVKPSSSRAPPSSHDAAQRDDPLGGRGEVLDRRRPGAAGSSRPSRSGTRWKHSTGRPPVPLRNT